MIEPEEKLSKNLEKLLDVVFNDPTYYPGSFHKKTDISGVIDCVYTLLFEKQENTSIHLIIDKNSNNSINITVDKIS